MKRERINRFNKAITDDEYGGIHDDDDDDDDDNIEVPPVQKHRSARNLSPPPIGSHTYLMNE